eukprot:SAG31_NODE_17399_length_672_cov_0.993019_1_plen_52_part_10
MIVMLSSTIPCTVQNAASDLSERQDVAHTAGAMSRRTELRITCRKCGASSVS